MLIMGRAFSGALSFVRVLSSRSQHMRDCCIPCARTIIAGRTEKVDTHPQLRNHGPPAEHASRYISGRSRSSSPHEPATHESVLRHDRLVLSHVVPCAQSVTVTVSGVTDPSDADAVGFLVPYDADRNITAPQKFQWCIKGSSGAGYIETGITSLTCAPQPLRCASTVR